MAIKIQVLQPARAVALPVVGASLPVRAEALVATPAEAATLKNLNRKVKQRKISAGVGRSDKK